MLPELATGVAVAGLATWFGFAAMWPTMPLYGRSFVGLPPGSRQLALTYDDGPNAPHPLKLSDILARQDVRATFFVLGRFVEQKPHIVRALAEAGHAIGNHSWNNPRLIFAPPPKPARPKAAVFEACGVTPTLFRPPYGDRRPGTLTTARQLGLEPVMW